MIYFLFGLAVGLVFFSWKSYSIDRRLNEILDSLSQIENVNGLNKLAQVRRKVNRLNHNHHYIQLELKLYQKF